MTRHVTLRLGHEAFDELITHKKSLPSKMSWESYITYLLQQARKVKDE